MDRFLVLIIMSWIKMMRYSRNIYDYGRYHEKNKIKEKSIV